MISAVSWKVAFGGPLVALWLSMTRFAANGPVAPSAKKLTATGMTLLPVGPGPQRTAGGTV